MQTDIALSDGTEKIARFQSFHPGQYWRAQRAIADEGIDEGEVLLIQSIRWVDDAAHTVILLPHPTKIGKRVTLKIVQDDGSIQERRFHYDEHRFLLNDFLAAFEFEPDHQRIRSDELEKVQGRIASLQGELLDAQKNPALLAGVVEQGLRESAQKVAAEKRNDADPDAREQGAGAAPATPLALAQPNSQMATMASGTVAAAIGSGITAEGIAELKKAVGQEHQIATIKANWIQSKTTAIAETIQAMTPFYAEQAAAALAQTEDVRAYVDKLMLGIASLDLYVGKDVDVSTICKGASAPSNVPLTFVQRKLAMDEEVAVWADVDERFDFSNEDVFFEALGKHEELVNQIFPTQRCVLVMAATRRDVDYGDALTNALLNHKNKKVFLMVRDGANIYRVFSPVESHLGSARLFPSDAEHKRIFRGMDGSQIKFEDVAYTDKLAVHEKAALHYKRFLLLACGLDHRLKLFGDFYAGPPTMHFVSLDFQQQHCRFLHDDDGAGLLPGEARQPLQDWIESMNAYLRSGSRVLCNWRELMNPETAPGACKARSGTYSERFDRIYEPKKGVDVSVAIAFKDAGDLCVDVEVTGNSLSTGADRTFTCKVSLLKSAASTWGHIDLPFLCLDAVQPEDLHWYIHNRDTRRNHLHYIRFFKRAAKFIEAERAGEMQTRQQLIKAMSDGGIAAPDERLEIVNQAVIAWRAANRGKALPSGDGRSPSAWKSLLDQMYMLAGEGQRRTAEVEAFVRRLGLEPLRLVISGTAQLVVYAAPKAHERDDRLEPHAWVHKITLELKKAVYSEKSRRWISLPAKSASETTLHEWEGAQDWSTLGSLFPSLGSKLLHMANAGLVQTRLKPFAAAAMSEADFGGHFSDWQATRDRACAGSRSVHDVSIVIPFGLVYYRRDKAVKLLCVRAVEGHGALAQRAPDDDAVGRLRNDYARPFAEKIKARNRFNHALTIRAGVGEPGGWDLCEAPLSLVDHQCGAFVSKHSLALSRIGNKTHSPLLADWFDSWSLQNADFARVWIADEARSAGGRLCLDALLGIELPPNYDPVRVREFRLSGNHDKDGVPLPKHRQWFDLCPGAEAPGAGSSWLGRNDQELEKLLKGFPRERLSVTSTQQVFLTRAKARAYIARAAHAPASFGSFSGESAGVTAAKYRAIPASLLASAPQPPDGIERWYALNEGEASSEVATRNSEQTSDQDYEPLTEQESESEGPRP